MGTFPFQRLFLNESYLQRPMPMRVDHIAPFKVSNPNGVETTGIYMLKRDACTCTTLHSRECYGTRHGDTVEFLTFRRKKHHDAFEVGRVQYGTKRHAPYATRRKPHDASTADTEKRRVRASFVRETRTRFDLPATRPKLFAPVCTHVWYLSRPPRCLHMSQLSRICFIVLPAESRRGP